MKDILTRFKNGEFAINTETQSEYDALMGVFDRRTDIAWPFGYRPTGKSVFGAYRELTSISCVGVTLKCRPTGYYELKGMEVVSFNQFRSEYNKKENSDQSSYYDAIKELYDNNYNLFLEKNRKYGNSFQDTFNELGKISALTRMNDKFNRIKTMMLSNELDNEESLVDSLLDLSNYALMTVYELQQKEV